MPYRGKRSNRPAMRRTRKNRKISKPLKVAPSVKTYVNRVIARNTENKVHIIYGSNVSITTAAGGTVPTSVNCLPVLGTGVGSFQRIGDEIKIKKAAIKGYINLLPYAAITNPLSTPIYVKMWLCSSKIVNTSSLSSTDIGTQFFDTGSIAAGFQGNMLDMTLSNNLNNWKIHAQRTVQLGATSVSSTGQVGSGGYFDNSKMSVPFYFNWAKYMKSKLKYNDSATNVITNKNLFLAFQAVNADGSSSAINVAEFHYSQRIEYEDA